MFKHITESHLWVTSYTYIIELYTYNYIQCTYIIELIQTCMLPLKIYVLSEPGNHTLIKTHDPCDPAFRPVSRLLSEMAQLHSILQSKFNNYPNLLKFPPKIFSTTIKQKVV